MRPIDLAESALVGRLLLEPRRIVDIPWLGPDDFVETGRSAVFAEVRRQVTAGGEVDAVSIADALRSGPAVGRFGDAAGPDLVSANRLHALIAVTPAPFDGDVVLYGQMVLEAVVRRQVRGLGVQVSAAPHGEPSLAASRTIEATDHVLDAVETLRTRWQAPTPEAQAADAYRYRLDAARQLAHVDPPDREAVAVAERHLIAAAVTGLPIDSLLARFSPDDFAEQATAATWRAVATLHDTGQPVNTVSVAWEQQRNSAAAGRGLPVDELRALALVPPIGVDVDADVVASAWLSRVAESASRNLMAAADHAGLAPDDVLTTTAVTVQAVRSVAERVRPRLADPASAAEIAERAAQATKEVDQSAARGLSTGDAVMHNLAARRNSPCPRRGR